MPHDSGLGGMPLKRIFFHVGAPKTGTTYLQNVLFENRDALAGNGVLYPYTDRGQSFRSMQDFRAASWGSQPAEAFRGEWEVVAQRCRDWQGGTVIISNELLGGSPVDRIARGVTDVSRTDGKTRAEVHVVFTARDLARQLVSDWQEQVKHKHTVTLERFVGDLIELGIDAPEPFGELFWGMHDPAYVLQRWSPAVPLDNIHIVTVPPPGQSRGALWQRFCSVVGVDPSVYQTEVKAANTSMGVAETELLRRINADVQGMEGPHYDLLARRYLAEEVLGNSSGKLTLPPDRMPWVVQRSAVLIDEVRTAGYQVVGDLDELLPREADHHPHISPTELSEGDLAAAAIRVCTALMKRAAHMRRRIVDLEAALQEGHPPPQSRGASDVMARIRAVARRVMPRRK